MNHVLAAEDMLLLLVTGWANNNDKNIVFVVHISKM